MSCRLTLTTEYDILRLIEIFISQEQWKVNEIQKRIALVEARRDA
jgi:hypothetical protein